MGTLGELPTAVVGDSPGDLYLVGTGNPALAREETESLADQVYRAASAGAEVSALSGYCGRDVFSVLVRGTSVQRAQRGQDRVAARLARD